jgi:hypothetical protein
VKILELELRDSMYMKDSSGLKCYKCMAGIFFTVSYVLNEVILLPENLILLMLKFGKQIIAPVIMFKLSKNTPPPPPSPRMLVII